MSAKYFLVTNLFLLIVFNSFAQNIGINATGAAPNSSALLDVASSNKGLLIPRVALTATTSALPITTPAPSLMVYNTATVSDVFPGYYYWNGTKWLRFINTGNSSGTDWSLTGNAGTTVGTNFLGTTDAQDFAVYTNNTERMRITASGNVGIGTTNPTAVLHTAGYTFKLGDARYSSLALSGYNIIESDGTNLILRAPIDNSGKIIVSDGDSPGAMEFENAGISRIDSYSDYSTSTSSALVLQNRSGGKVGIGTTNPGAKLEVAGQVKITGGTPGAGKVLTSDAVGLASWSGSVAAQATANNGITTTSTVWIDLANMLVSITTKGNPLLLNFTTQAVTNTGGALMGFRFVVDGVAVTAAVYGNAMMQNPPSVTSYQQNIAMTWLASGLAAGVHTVKVQWKVSSGLGYAPQSGEESDRTLVVYEIK